MKAYTGFALTLAADSVTGKQDRFLPCRCVFEGSLSRGELQSEERSDKANDRLESDA